MMIMALLVMMRACVRDKIFYAVSDKKRRDRICMQAVNIARKQTKKSLIYLFIYLFI